MLSLIDGGAAPVQTCFANLPRRNLRTDLLTLRACEITQLSHTTYTPAPEVKQARKGVYVSADLQSTNEFDPSKLEVHQKIDRFFDGAIHIVRRTKDFIEALRELQKSLVKNPPKFVVSLLTLILLIEHAYRVLSNTIPWLH